MIAPFIKIRPGKSASGTGPHRRRRSRGQSLVEFAVVFPVFMLVLSGILDFGFMLYSRMTVISATREGARAAITQADAVSVIPQRVADAVGNAVSGTGLDESFLQSLTSITVTCFRAGSSCNFATDTGAKAGDSVDVTVTYPYHSFFPLLFGSTFNLSSTVQMVIE